MEARNRRLDVVHLDSRDRAIDNRDRRADNRDRKRNRTTMVFCHDPSIAETRSSADPARAALAGTPPTSNFPSSVRERILGMTETP